MRLAPLLLLVASCQTSESDGQHPELRAAVDRADYSLAGYVERAEASLQHSTGVKARIERIAEQFAVETLASAQRHRVRLDFAGVVIATEAAGAGEAGCQTQITLTQALAAAEAAVGGNAVAVAPDDDDPCLREIQVLVEQTLWEVKVGPTGAIVETELSDEDL